jgi:hypothetical protein
VNIVRVILDFKFNCLHTRSSYEVIRMKTDAEGGDLLISDHWSDSSCMHLVSFYEDDIWLFFKSKV